MATSAKKASRFIARLIDNGYNDTGLAVLLPVLLRDLEMNDASPDDIMILLTTDVFTFLRTVSDKIGINRAISICDELCAPTKVNILLWCDVILPAISDNQIINHNINQSYTTLLRVYGQGYRVISNNVSQYRIDSLEYQKSGKYVYTVNNAFDNGLYVPSIVMYESMAKSEMDGCMTLGKPIVVPKHLTEIHKTSLSDSDEQKLVKMISPFLVNNLSKNLAEIRKISLLNCEAKDSFDILRLCRNLDELRIDLRSAIFLSRFKDMHCIQNVKRLTVNFSLAWFSMSFPYLEEFDESRYNHPTEHGSFTSRLKILRTADHISGGINDQHIHMCTNLRELHVGSGVITTCDPFAKSLKILSPRPTCGITNTGLANCTRIIKLCVNDNPKITTCKPFAKTLKILDACRNCGITDTGLSNCIRITKLCASDNTKITTCKPFAKTLKILNASGDCGITDAGLADCSHVTNLYANENAKITTCAPFAKTLKMLDACGICGITDAGLADCICIVELSACYNEQITTCAPFAKTLKILSASRNCGITNAGLTNCINITDLYAVYNDKITIYTPFEKTLVALTV